MTAEVLIEKAAEAHAAGRLDEAGGFARKALESDSENVQALILVGIVEFKKGNPASAIPLLTKALRLRADSFDAAFWLSLIFRKIGRLEEGLAMAQKAVAVDERSEHAQNQLGMCYLDLKRPNQAAACFANATKLSPNTAPFFDNLGRALQAMGRNDEAVAAFRCALSLGPANPAALYRLGDLLMAIPDVRAAAHCAREILRLEPNSAPGNLLLSRALIGEGLVSEGAEYAKRAMELSPKNAVPVAYYGRALQSLGRIEEADTQFQRSISLEPRQGFAYHALVHNHKVTENERPLVEKMRELASEGGLPKRELIQLEYGLGKALEDLGEYGDAMVHFDEANRIDHELKVGVIPFNPAVLASTVTFLIETFTRPYIERYKSEFATRNNSGTGPIFVVGMMRSGTTLAEQILSSHRDVGGAGEQLFWPDNAGSGEKLFHGGAGLDVTKLKRLSLEYLALLESISPGKSKVVDKMNTNYLLLGPLSILFPEAAIVHMKRNPVDTCLSIWATPVANGIDLCGSKENVVFAYEQYLRLMEHWREVIPSNRLIDVQYEELVNDQERVTREMVAFCGLEWDDSCLRPEENPRSVRTPSVWQVRQPVYRTSTARWKKYEPWLGAFERLMEL